MEIKKTWDKYSRPAIALLFTAWGMYLRAVTLAGRPLWVDEVCSYNGMRGAFKPFWQHLSYGAELTAFPGQYLTTWMFVDMFGPNKWGIMIPHILATLAGFYLLYLLCRRYLKNPLSYAVVFALFCFNRELIFHSFEFRPYAVLPTLSLAVFYCTQTVFSTPAKELTTASKLWIGSLFVFTVMYHAYGGVLLFLTVLFFFLWETAKRPVPEVLRQTWRFFLAVGLIAIPLFLWYALGSQALMGRMWRNTFQFIPHPFTNGSGFLKGVFCNLMGFTPLYFLFLGLILAFLIPHKNRSVQFGFFLILVIVPVGLLLVLDLIKNYWFLQRQFIWVTPLFIFLVGWCWEDIFCWAANHLPGIKNTFS